MNDWDFLIDDDAVAAVIPKEYAHFRQPVREALAVFLAGLPARHQETIVADQATLPVTATIERRLARLAQSCPVLHKLGQMLARDRRLSPELRRHLQTLESLPPSVPLPAIRAVLAREFGHMDCVGLALAPPAIAEASVAVVIPFRRCRGQGVPPEHGVLKVLKPGIEARLGEELDLLTRVGEHLDERCHDLGIPPLEYRDAFEQVRERLRHELRLDLEQKNLARARAAYEGDARVQIPALLDLCSPRVTAMERITGGKVTDHGLSAADERRKLAGLVVEALLARPFFSSDAAALFHADPHAGNLFFTTDGRLAILDWSLAGSLGELERDAVVQILLGATSLHTGRVFEALAGLNTNVRLHRPALATTVEKLIGQVRRGKLPGFIWLMNLVDEAVQTAGWRPSADLLLFRKTMHTLEGVLADIGTGHERIDAVLSAAFVREFVGEWPRRWLAPPRSRAFGTRVSNADLTRLALNGPWTAMQFWLDQAVDFWKRAG
jgi:ubiquinone biosynthesis protein